jgi:hypothetical protein
MPGRKEVMAYQRRRRTKLARDINMFSSLVNSPFDLGSASAGNALGNTFNLPGTARLGVSIDAVTAAGDITVSVGGRVFGIAGGAADRVFRLDVGIRGREVELSRGVGAPAGNVKLYVLDEWQRPYVVAEGVFS